MLAWTGGNAAGATPPSDDARKEVVRVVQRFFDAMSAQDAAGIRAVFHPGAQFSSSRPMEDGIRVSSDSIEHFAARAAVVKERYLERMWSPTVLFGGGIAVVWARYDFHVGRRFSHNGTDCFTLLLTAEGWRIASLAFTVEPGPRTEHPSGAPAAGVP